jgi:cysteine synthase
MDFIFGDYITFKNHKGNTVCIDPTAITMIEQDDAEENSCAVAVKGRDRPFFVPMSAQELVDRIAQIRNNAAEKVLTMLFGPQQA